jgi:hypothetical protein
LRFPREGAGALGVSRRHGSFRLIHELANLRDHALLVLTQLLADDLLEILFCGRQHLIGSVPLLVCLDSSCASSELNAGL